MKNGSIFNGRNKSDGSYTAASVEVLEGLDPVRRRPGMYTDTQRPTHLAQEVQLKSPTFRRVARWVGNAYMCPRFKSMGCFLS